MKAKIVIAAAVLLGVYVGITVSAGRGPLKDDEGRYAAYAENISHGFYGDKESKCLWNGPGYPLVLAPLAAMHIPMTWGRSLNPLFMLGCVGLVYLLLREYVPRPVAAGGAIITAVFPPLLIYMPRLLTESLSVLLMASFCFFTVRYFEGRRTRDCWLAGISCGFLLLTKVMFAYVWLGAFVVAIVLRLMRRPAGRMAEVYAIALLVCLPYLLYTWSLTGKVFYWSNAGGSSLYCMTMNVDKGYGDWNAFFGPQGRLEHADFLAELEKMDYVARDEFLKQEAVRNIESNPGTYLANVAANLGRLWYNLPYYSKFQRPETLAVTVPNSALFMALLACVYPLVRYRRRIPPAVGALMLFAGIYLVGASLVFAVDRYLLPLLPIFMLVILFTFTRLVEIRPADPS